MRRALFCVLALSMLSACGMEEPQEAVPINGSGGSGGGGSTSGSTGGSVGGVAILSHNAGTDCLSCHRSGGSGASGGIFTVAGTVYRDSGQPHTMATVQVYPDGDNNPQATMTTDGLGNFFTTQPVASLVPAAGQQFARGARVVVRSSNGSRSMLGVITNGSCNACHSAAGGVARVNVQNADVPFGVSTQSAGGNGESAAISAAPAIAESFSLAQVAVGSAHACVVKSDGAVMCWGGNAHGQLGEGVLGSLMASTGEGSIAAGDRHTCVISGGQPLCWGDNSNGQLGNGSTGPAAVSAPALANVTALSAAGDSTCAQVGSGNQAEFWCWGSQQPVLQSAAPLLVNPGADAAPAALMPLLQPAPVTISMPVAGLESVKFRRIATAAKQGCGITTDDRLKCWDGPGASVDIPVN